jgi:hypothetical protein
MIAIKDMEMPKNCGECDCSCWHDYCGTYFCSLTGNDVLENQKDMDCPLVEIEENKVGKWIDCGHVDRGFRKYKCSICSDFVYEKEYLIKHHKYCLHCGADMVGAENEN